MHRSRLTSALFDVPQLVMEAETAFWSGALGAAVRRDDEDPEYVQFEGLFGGLEIMVQQVGEGTPARVHIDIETDDVEAEVQRLEALGATRVETIKSWWLMRDPAGLLFCVVRVQSPEEFEAHATTWGEGA
jgi:predicted enzyme related to lactoylglutathione lyase